MCVLGSQAIYEEARCEEMDREEEWRGVRENNLLVLSAIFSEIENGDKCGVCGVVLCIYVCEK